MLPVASDDLAVAQQGLIYKHDLDPHRADEG
jgi:hypothetical protein